MSHFKIDKNCNSKPNQNTVLYSLRIRKLVEGKINFEELESSSQKIQLKKETFKIGQFEFIILKENLKRKTACSIQPNKAYFVSKRLDKTYSHSDLRLVALR